MMQLYIYIYLHLHLYLYLYLCLYPNIQLCTHHHSTIRDDAFLLAVSLSAHVHDRNNEGLGVDAAPEKALGLRVWRAAAVCPRLGGVAPKMAKLNRTVMGK